MRKVSGIYQIKNKVNNKIYIGSAASFYYRWAEHKFLLRKQNHSNYHLQNAWNKYGEDSFEFFIVEECPEDKLIEKEQYYFDKLKPEYNICKIAGNTSGYKFTEKQKQKLEWFETAHRINKENIVFMQNLQFEDLVVEEYKE